jgi:hypothetical protein
MEDQSSLGFTRDEDFESLYATNVNFEPSVWDLKLIFGQLDQSSGRAVVKQHTAISVPWIQVKLMAYYLEAQLAIHDIDFGAVIVPPSLIPPSPDPTSPEIQGNELAEVTAKYLLLIHEKYFGGRSQMPPQEAPACSPDAPTTGE